jgi:hypothetical protein
METKFTNVLASLVFEANPDFTSRLDEQEEALGEITCIDPTYGLWVDAADVPYMLAALSLGDEDFARMFPAMAHVAGPERQRFAAALTAHFSQCLRCRHKRDNDLELGACIEQACRQNSDSLLQLLEDDEAE